MVKMGSNFELQSLKNWIFCYFFQFLLKGFNQLNELESESDIYSLKWRPGKHFPISHFTLSLTHSALVDH